MWRPTSYRLPGGHNQSALNTASYDLKCEATREMFVDEELMAQSDYLARPMSDPMEAGQPDVSEGQQTQMPPEGSHPSAQAHKLSCKSMCIVTCRDKPLMRSCHVGHQR